MFAFATRVVSGVLCSLEGTGNEPVPYGDAALFQFFAELRWDLPRESHQSVKFHSHLIPAIHRKRLPLGVTSNGSGVLARHGSVALSATTAHRTLLRSLIALLFADSDTQSAGKWEGWRRSAVVSICPAFNSFLLAPGDPHLVKKVP